MTGLIKKRTLIIFLASIFVAAFLTCAPDPAIATPEHSKNFDQGIQFTVQKLATLRGLRPHRLKRMNDALDYMANAAYLMRNDYSLGEALEFLEESIKSYHANHLGYLLAGVIEDSRGDMEESTQWYKKFLQSSRSYSKFEEQFISEKNFHLLRRQVLDMLESRGVSFEGDEKSIQFRSPMRRFIQQINHPSPQDEWLNMFFVSVILGGGILILICPFMGVRVNHPAYHIAASLYVVTWLSYGCWLYDLAVGLPFGWNRRVLIPLLYIGVLAFSGGGEILDLIRHRTRPLADGYRRCPKCHDVIEKLHLECPKCGLRISEQKS